MIILPEVGKDSQINQRLYLKQEKIDIVFTAQQGF